MGLAESLEYRHIAPNRAQHAVQWMARQPLGAWLLARTLRRADRATLWATRNRHSLSSLVAGLQVINLTTVGARTGRSRSAFVLAFPFEEGLAVAGANFGQRPQPGWVANLRARPRAEVAYRGRRSVVEAREVNADEFAAIQGLARGVYPGTADYLRRIRSRRLRVFLLTAVSTE